MRRRLPMFTVAAVAIVALGYLSDVLAIRRVEDHVSRQNVESAEWVARLWKVPSEPRNLVDVRSIIEREGESPEGRHVTWHMPPKTKPPFVYAHARPIAPFVLRVRSGWAVAGTRMAFGEGADLLVFSFFGRANREVKKTVHWNF